MLLERFATYNSAPNRHFKQMILQLHDTHVGITFRLTLTTPASVATKSIPWAMASSSTSGKPLLADAGDGFLPAP